MSYLPDSYTLTEAFAEKVFRAPKAIRSEVLKELATTEFSRCAADPLYWLDTAKHPALTYAYTVDKRPFYQCKLCVAHGHVLADASIPLFRLESHLHRWHNKKPKEGENPALFYNEIPRTRPFTVKPYMPPMIEWWQKSQFFAVEKSRDMIATWLMSALITWDVLFHKETQWVVQSETAAKSLEIIRDRCFFMWRHQPKFLRSLHPANCIKGPAGSGELKVPTLGSELLGFAQGPDQIRYLHPAGVFLDEAAFQDKAKDAVGAIQPAIKQGGRLNMISSANPSYFQLICEDRLDDAI